MRSLRDSVRSLLLLAAMALLVGCGASEPADEPNEAAASTQASSTAPAGLDPAFAAALEAAEREAIDQLPPGPGKDAITGGCMTCHDAAIIQLQRKDRDAWTRSVQNMVGWGAQLSAEQEQIAIDYLAEHFGPER